MELCVSFMENQRQSIVMDNCNGALRLPPGFRFHPTDEELVLHYLRRKVFSFPLPATIIPEIDLGKFDPWDLPGGCEHQRYFFVLREAKYRNGGMSNRTTESGYWKATSKDRAIIASKYRQVIGMKKTLVFYKRKAGSKWSRTDWIMHEYHLANRGVVSTRDWVLCRIFMKKRANNMDFDREEASSDSESSCVTTESSDEDDDDDDDEKEEDDV